MMVVSVEDWTKNVHKNSKSIASNIYVCSTPRSYPEQPQSSTTKNRVVQSVDTQTDIDKN